MTSKGGEDDWSHILPAIHKSVREAVFHSGRQRTGTMNRKGDEVKLFDLDANDAAVAVLKDTPLPVVVDSEEFSRLEIGLGTLLHRLILDPVDGSDNWSRGLPLSAGSFLSRRWTADSAARETEPGGQRLGRQASERRGPRR